VVQAACLQNARAGGPPAPRPRPLHQPEMRFIREESLATRARRGALGSPSSPRG